MTEVELGSGEGVGHIIIDGMDVFNGNLFFIGGGATLDGMLPSVGEGGITTPSVDEGAMTPSDGQVGTEEDKGVASND
jgi:hypothetical protein